ncbi:DUF3568 family protein [Pseudofrancisella aestuarii]|uniref:DUF3568 family protein n=1 Tax=Pseudofrancisella aestuarii TaxID=2670347 RepID=A0ABV9TAE0_9GAMM|nr:DUF3568 family protein [Pseudofrancisella aestuarii]
MRFIKFLILLISSISLNSCLLFVAPYAIQQNAKVSQTYDYNLIDVYKATIYKINSTEGASVVSVSGAGGDYSKSIQILGKIDSSDYKGKFNINIDKVTNTSSKFTIKYNILGDKVQSHNFLASIKKILDDKSYLQNNNTTVK